MWEEQLEQLGRTAKDALWKWFLPIMCSKREREREKRVVISFFSRPDTGCVVKGQDHAGGILFFFFNYYSPPQWAVLKMAWLCHWWRTDNRCGNEARLQVGGPIKYRGVAPNRRGHRRGRCQKRKCVSADLSLSFGHGRLLGERGQPRSSQESAGSVEKLKKYPKNRTNYESGGVGLVKEPRLNIFHTLPR